MKKSNLNIGIALSNAELITINGGGIGVVVDFGGPGSGG